MKYFNIYCLFAHFWQSNCYTSEEWQSDDSLPTEEQLEVDRGSFTLKRLGAFVIGDLSCWFLWVLFFFFCPHHCVGILPIISLQVWKWKRKLLGCFFFPIWEYHQRKLQHKAIEFVCLTLPHRSWIWADSKQWRNVD